MCIGIAGGYRDGFPYFGLAQHQSAVCGTCDSNTTGFPLVADDAQPVDVAQGVGCCEGLALSGDAAEGDCAGGRAIGVRDVESEIITASGTPGIFCGDFDTVTVDVPVDRAWIAP